MVVQRSSIEMKSCRSQVKRPQQFDIMLMPNLYGNIISNIACGLVGGPGLVSGINLGDKYAVFETVSFLDFKVLSFWVVLGSGSVLYDLGDLS